jgi:hypothetical protein
MEENPLDDRMMAIDTPNFNKKNLPEKKFQEKNFIRTDRIIEAPV